MRQSDSDRRKHTLRDKESQLDHEANVLDVATDISFRETLCILWRVCSYFRLFAGRITAKIGFITVESLFRLLFVPWPAKIIVDHVILGDPIPPNAAGFPGYLAPFVLLLEGMSAVEMMFWIIMLGVAMVIVFGSTTNRGAARSASGMPSGTSAGASGATFASLAQGHDTATQTENQANYAGSLMGGILGILDFKVNLRLSQSLSHVLRSQVTEHIAKLPITTLDDQRIGDSVYRVLYDTTSATLLLEALSVGMFSGVLGVVVCLFIMYTNYGNAPEVIVLAICSFPLMLLFVVPFARMARRRSQASRAAGANTTRNIEEGMSNVLAVQSLGGNKHESERFNKVSQESFKRFRFEALVKLTFQQFGSLAFMLGNVLFFVVMAGRIIEGTFTAGDYFVVIYYHFVLSATFSAWGYMYTEWQTYIAGLRRVFFTLDLPTEKREGLASLPQIEESLEVRGVSLSYPDGRRALADVDLSAKVGEIIALVGPTGAGKTSLAFLVPRFIEPSSGQVLVDGRDLSQFSVESIRSQVSYVFQETQLFADSIAANIRYGNRSATHDQVIHAARVAGAHEFIEVLPNGYDTSLGTVTSKLSVGQKQRIAIARGLLRNSRILILDEPTSALDPETEKYLISALMEAAQDKLVIIIAHRLSTIRHADCIYFLENGGIVESGNHEEMMNLPDGRYRQYIGLHGNLAL